MNKQPAFPRTRTRKDQKLFVDLKEEKPPHWILQALLGCLAATAFILIFYVTI